jgi:enamine deaminase RidA (YjgF/YER057c/UK114 family)
MTSTPHALINPPGLAPPVGYSHAVVAAPGRTVYLGGQAALDAEGRVIGGSLVEQFDRACAGVVEALRAAGGRPEHLVSLQIFTTDAAAYRASLRELGEVYRRHFGRHYPAMILVEVRGLFDPGLMVELLGVGVIPEEG